MKRVGDHFSLFPEYLISDYHRRRSIQRGRAPRVTKVAASKYALVHVSILARVSKSLVCTQCERAI